MLHFVKIETDRGKTMKKLLILSVALLLVGCATHQKYISDVAQIGPNQYMSSASYTRTDGAPLVVDLVKQGNAYCAKQGKSFVLTSQKYQNGIDDGPYRNGLFQRATAQITFSCN